MGGPDYSAIMAQLDFGNVVVAILAIFGAISGLYLTYRGCYLVLKALGVGGSGLAYDDDSPFVDQWSSWKQDEYRAWQNGWRPTEMERANGMGSWLPRD